MSLKLYADQDSPLTKLVQIVAKYSGVELTVAGQDKEEKTSLGKSIVLETEEGRIWEVNAIARYLVRADENSTLYGWSEFDKAQIDQWLDFALSEISLPAKIWILPILGRLEDDPACTNKAKADIRKVLQILNDHLSDNTFLVADRLTLADIVVAIHLLQLYTLVLDAGFRKTFVNTNRWFTTVVNQTHFKEVLGEVTLATKMAVAQKSDKPKEEKPKQEKKPQEKKVVEQPKQEKKPKKKDDDDDNEFVEEKPKSALDLLPKSPLDLDEWKRTYSNNDTPVAMKWFWEHYDKEGYSIWFCDYKYNDELNSLLKTCNLIGGWFQRLDRLRKYGFSNAVIFNNEAAKHFEISGCWLFRGNDVPQEMTSCDDAELYTWTKANPEDPDVKKRIEEYWSWTGSFDGRKFEQGKTFK